MVSPAYLGSVDSALDDLDNKSNGVWHLDSADSDDNTFSDVVKTDLDIPMKPSSSSSKHHDMLHKSVSSPQANVMVSDGDKENFARPRAPTPRKERKSKVAYENTPVTSRNRRMLIFFFLINILILGRIF